VNPTAEPQPVREAELLAELNRAERPRRRRRAIAGPVGVALLLAGGGLLVRVAILIVQGQDATVHYPWVFTAAACVLAGVALLLITLPKIVPAERGDRKPTPVPNG
jgi:hypothetical protein